MRSEKRFEEALTKTGQAPLEVTFLNDLRLSAGASPGFVRRSKSPLRNHLQENVGIGVDCSFAARSSTLADCFAGGMTVESGNSLFSGP